jgi:hypothetical protein
MTKPIFKKIDWKTLVEAEENLRESRVEYEFSKKKFKREGDNHGVYRDD